MTILFDYRGMPVAEKSLLSEQITASVTSVRSPYVQSVAFGLTPERLVYLINDANNGQHERYLMLAHEMEKRDPNYLTAMQKRRFAVTQLPMSVHPWDDSPEAERRANAADVFVQSPSFGLALADIMDALGKGFSVVEVIWDTSEGDWHPVEFHWRDQWWFKFDHPTARELRVIDHTADGSALQPFKYLDHRPKITSGSPIAGGLARIVSFYHLFKSYALKDWMAFAEVFGIPIRIGKYSSGATDAAKSELERAVRMIGSDAAAVIHDSMTIEFERSMFSGMAGSDGFFQGLADWLDRQVSKAVTGEAMADEKGSFAKAKVMNEVRADIRNNDARQLEMTINRDLLRPWYDLNYGKPAKRNQYPFVRIDTSEPADLVMLATALPPFIDRGLPVTVNSLLEKFGLPQPEAGETLLQKEKPNAQPFE